MPEEKEPQIVQPLKGEQEKHDEAYRFLTNIPEGLEATDWKLKEWAKQYNETICISVAPRQELHGWYVYLPDGRKSRIAGGEGTLAGTWLPGEPPRAYLVYLSNGEVAAATSPTGIEVKYASKFKKTE